MFCECVDGFEVYLGFQACLAFARSHVLEQVEEFAEADAAVAVQIEFVEQLGDYLWIEIVQV